MTSRPLLGALLLTGILTLTPSVHAWTCEEYASDTYHFALWRDRGISYATSSAVNQQEVTLGRRHPTIAALYQDIINAVHAEPTVTPAVWQQRAYQACLDFARIQPPRAPQLQPPRRK